MIFTPTSTSGAAAGAGFWSLTWLMVFKSDSVAHFCGYENSHIRDNVFSWVTKNKAISFLSTEVINLAIHWKALSSPNLMAFVLGGSLANFGWIFGVIPGFQAIKGLTRKAIV